MEANPQFKQLLEEYPSDPNKQDAVARRLRSQARSVALQAAVVWSAPTTEHDRAAAHALLDGMEELSIVPMLEVGPPREAENVVQYLDMVIDPAVALRERIVATLLPLLDDKRSIPEREVLGPPPDEREQPRRVCDEAYLKIRRLMHAGRDDPESEAGNRAVFLFISEESRDAEIARARSTGSWDHELDPSVDDANGSAVDKADRPLPQD